MVYEGLSRSPTPLFNEKVLAGLGAHIAETGRLDEGGVVRALAALRRFRVLAKQAGADAIYTLATAAAREAENGPAFVRDAKKILRGDVHVLTGPEEAHYAALGIVCGFVDPIGVSGDMGGGSVEFTAVDGQPLGNGVTKPLGGLRLQDESGGDVKIARQMCKEALAAVDVLRDHPGTTFYAVGGTWRALGRLHMARCDYPLHVMHDYSITADEALKLCKSLTKGHGAAVRGIEHISTNRRGLLPFGAVLLEQVIKIMKPERIVFQPSACARDISIPCCRQRCKRPTRCLRLPRKWRCCARAPRSTPASWSRLRTMRSRPPDTMKPNASAATGRQRVCWRTSLGGPTRTIGEGRR